MAKQDKEYYKKYCEENKFKISERKRLYYEQKKNDILEKQKKYYNENSELIKEREKKKYKDNIEESRKRGRDYYENNKEKFLTKQKERYDIDGAEKIKKRRLADPIFKLKGGIGNRLRDFLKQNGYNKNKKTFQTIGCTPQEKPFLFEKKMSSNHIKHLR
jgi:hypothetical protein